MFRTWLIRILKNECFDMLRKRKPVLDPNDCDAGYEMEVPDLDLNRAFDRLTPDERLAITLYYYEGYRTTEIAKITDVSEGTVRSRLSRARAALKEQLSEKERNV
jgi:RNA polymerase sigma-70 factor (ECF subfamily)